MLNLNQAEKFFRRFTIKDRRTNRPIPFQLNPSQVDVMESIKAHVARRRRLFVIFLKGRRLGISTLARFLLLAHALEKGHAEGLIMAQIDVVAKELFDEVHKLTQQLPMTEGTEWKHMQSARLLKYLELQSRITYKTAGSVAGSRGLGFTMLHATEAAYYDNPDVWPAVLNTISDDPEAAALIETTPNGKEGPGKGYYDLWQASYEGETEFLAKFLPWFDDPDYVRDPRSLPRALQLLEPDEYEVMLVKKLKLKPERIAFFRWTLRNKCNSKLETWRQEFPSTPEEAFETAGNPVFTFADQTVCKQWVDSIGSLGVAMEIRTIPDAGHRAQASERKDGRFKVYEKPRPGAHYFAGVVVGHADPDEDTATDEDTLAMVVWNGESGVLAACCQTPLLHTNATELVYACGCYYNRAMVAVEDGLGGYGTTIFQRLRDHHRYPNQYRWKGRNDKAHHKSLPPGLGFTINDYTRRMILNTLLTSIRRKEAMTSDEIMVEQMPDIQWESDGRFEAIAYFDDVFYAAGLGWIAREQYHPQKCKEYEEYQDASIYEEALNKIAHQKSPFVDTTLGIPVFTLQHHIDAVKRKEKEIAETR